MASLAGIEQLRAAVVDGRTQNVRYRQNELQSFHATLSNNADKIRSAISQDLNGSSTGVSSEAEAEYYYAMSAVKHFYSSLDFEKSLKDEYLLANGADNVSRRVGKGLVVIRPTTHTRFYSIVSPIVAALTAGNCICLELGDTMLNVDRVLRELLPEALDIDTFYISSTTLQESSILASAFLVDQSSNTTIPTLNQLSSNPSIRTIAVVDRAADIELAAKSIVGARFGFQGASPYSPDLVIVNDFIKSEFMEACIQFTSKFYSSNTGSKRLQTQRDSSTKKAFKDAEAKGQVSVFGSSKFVLADVQDRNSPITKMKISGCHLPILECTSLVDALMLQKSESTLLAVYLFADSSTAKFLAQHFDAAITYVNQIPLRLLIGPAAPITSIPAPAFHKYSTEMFSSERPQYISSPPSDLLAIEKLLEGGQKSESRAASLRNIRSSAVEPLPKTGQPLGYATGFFEQGIMLGAGLFLGCFIPAVGYGSWVLGRNAWKLVMQSRLS